MHEHHLAELRIVLRGKNDAADASAICEAVQRPHLRFVPIKSVEQQARMAVHRMRQGFVEQRTALINRLRGLLSEFGIVMAQKAATVWRLASDQVDSLPGWMRVATRDALDELARLDERISDYDAHLRHIARDDPRCQPLQQLPGIGETTAKRPLERTHSLQDGTR